MNELNPQPRAWPRCSRCKTAYVLRLAITFTTPTTKRMVVENQWVWQRDCKHRSAAPEAAGTLRIKARKRGRP